MLSSLEYARSNGTDMHSIVDAAAFANPAEGDYSLSDSSAAVTKGGFRNFSMDEFGVVSPRLKKIASKPNMPKVVSAVYSAESKIESWQGVEIKDLNTLGERSATGMDTERGVYVVSVDPLSGVHTGLMTNDVILSVDGHAVDNMKDFNSILKNFRAGDDVELVVFRSQKEMKCRLVLK